MEHIQNQPAGHIFGFDRYDNLYVTGYYDKYVYKISTKGKIIWKTNTFRTGNYWPYKVTASGTMLLFVRYELKELFIPEGS